MTTLFAVSWFAFLIFSPHTSRTVAWLDANDAQCVRDTLLSDLLGVLIGAVALTTVLGRRTGAVGAVENAVHVAMVIGVRLGAELYLSFAARCDVVLLDVRASDVALWTSFAIYVIAAVACLIQLQWTPRSAVFPLLAPVVALVASPVLTLSQVLLAISVAVVLMFGSSVAVSKDDQLLFELGVNLFKRDHELQR
jgi:hypothetical protein